MGLYVFCRMEDCGRASSTSIGYCVMHYKRWKRNGTPARVLAEPGVKPCTHCGVITNLRKGLCKACSIRKMRKGYVERDRNPAGTGGLNSDGYHVSTVKGKRDYTHRHMTGAKKGEVVHHKDKDRAHNEDFNLDVLASQSEHMKLHMRTSATETRKKED